MTNARLLVFGLLASLVLCSPALAHESSDRARGTVERIDERELAVKTSDGHTVTFAITPDTHFARGEAPARREEVKVGERVVVEGKRLGHHVEALRVKLATGSPPVAH
jgi:hypothetical protein